MPPKVSLEQWRTLVEVVESGGYAPAAERLHKSQSTLTYAIQQLERNLGVKAFEIRGRKAVLTEAGQVLFRRGKQLLDEAERLERAAASLASGWAAELRLAVDIIFPTRLLLGSLAHFSSAHPDVRIELIESVLSGTDEALLEGRVDLAITPAVPPGFLGDPILPVRFVPAAHPDHPLHQLGRLLTQEDLTPYRHLVVRNSGRDRSKTPGWLNERRLTVSHLSTSIRAATLGIGYAWYVEDMIRGELDSGLLKPLPMREGAERWVMLYLIFADRDAAGPCAATFVDMLKAEISQFRRLDQMQPTGEA